MMHENREQVKMPPIPALSLPQLWTIGGVRAVAMHICYYTNLAFEQFLKKWLALLDGM